MDFKDKFQYCPTCGTNQFEINNCKSKRCNKCGFIYYINPSAATAAFIINKNNELLVCRRANEPAKGTLDLPGGFIDFDETAEQAIQREILEELGVKTHSVQYLFSLPNDYLYSDLNVPTLDLFFRCQIDESCTITPADDVAECYFIPLNEVNPALFGLKSIKKAIQIYLAENNLDLPDKLWV